MATSRVLLDIFNIEGRFHIEPLVAADDSYELRIVLNGGRSPTGETVYGIVRISPQNLRVDPNQSAVTDYILESLKVAMGRAAEAFFSRRIFLRTNGIMPFALFAAEQEYDQTKARAEGVRALWLAESEDVRRQYAQRIAKMFAWLDEAP